MRAPAGILFLGVVAFLAGCSSTRALRERDPDLTESDVLAAARTGDPTLVPDLAYVVRHPDRFSPPAVVAAIDALGELGGDEALAALGTLLGDGAGDEEARWHAVGAAAAIGGPAARSLLEKVSDGDPSDLVREEARRLLASMGD